MRWGDLLGIAVALSMDALAVALATGFALRSATARHAPRLGIFFGAFQSATVTMGWIAGHAVRQRIAGAAPWIAFALLSVIGGRMLLQALHSPDADPAPDPTRWSSVIARSIATSIDGFGVGIPIAALGMGLWIPALVIGLVVAGFTIAGVIVGRYVGQAWGRTATIAGGVGLCAIGAKTLVVGLLGR